MTPREIRLGGPLFESSSDQLIPYLSRRLDVLLDRLRGLESAETPDEEQIAQVREDAEYYREFIRKGRQSHDSEGTV